jgi:hypothetical protein
LLQPIDRVSTFGRMSLKRSALYPTIQYLAKF